MKLFRALIVLFVGSTLASDLLPRRTAAIVLDDIRNITAQITVVQNSVNNYNGGAQPALTIRTQSQELSNLIQKGANDASASSAFSQQESVQVATAVTGIQRNIYSVLAVLVQKKPLFRTALSGSSVVPLVRSTLVSLQNSTQAFGGNVTSKLVAELKEVAPLITSNIDFHFDRAVDAFSTP